MAFRVSGMKIQLKRTEKVTSDGRSTLEHGIAALAASLQLAQLSQKDAVDLATAEGLVTHLTSLVLVDEAASVQDGIPLRRRVPLAPVLASFGFAGSQNISACVAPPSPLRRMFLRTSDNSSLQNGRYPSADTFAVNEEPDNTFRASIDALAYLIDWDEFGILLAQCQIDQLDDETAAELRRLAGSPAIKALADEKGIDAVRIVIILIASRAMRVSRSAFRVLRHLRANLAPDLIESILELDASNVI